MDQTLKSLHMTGELQAQLKTTRALNELAAQVSH